MSRQFYNDKNTYLNSRKKKDTNVFKSMPNIVLENTHAKLGEQWIHDHYSIQGQILEAWEADLWTHTGTNSKLIQDRRRYGGELPNIIIDNYYGQSVKDLKDVLDKEKLKAYPFEIKEICIDQANLKEKMNRIALIGGCPYNGKLYVFFTNDEEKGTFISLIVGTY